ncbi:MAG TPA: acylphosphatase [Magnetospirillum sp.]|jgi:acylphosphatase|nr:acylphosphatase [Magnetospirillum sp.]
MEHPQCVRVLIDGRVQGVWFRGWTVEQAQLRGLAGWVRNLSDGRVEAVFAGSPADVDDMVNACRRGPPSARVTSVEVEAWSDLPGHGFHQRPTV